MRNLIANSLMVLSPVLVLGIWSLSNENPYFGYAGLAISLYFSTYPFFKMGAKTTQNERMFYILLIIYFFSMVAGIIVITAWHQTGQIPGPAPDLRNLGELKVSLCIMFYMLIMGFACLKISDKEQREMNHDRCERV